MLHHADIAALPDLLPAGCADAVITDPLYDLDHIDLYQTLSRVSAHLLKPGGALVALTGTLHLPEVLTRLADSLTYFWTFSYDMPGDWGEPGDRPFFPQWKPAVCFVNSEAGDYSGPWFAATDKVRSDRPPRTLHRFEQSVEGMSALVTLVSRPGEVIVDPFCGSATTGAAALTRGRRFIGSDIDGDAVTTAAERLATLATDLVVSVEVYRDGAVGGVYSIDMHDEEAQLAPGLARAPPQSDLGRRVRRVGCTDAVEVTYVMRRQYVCQRPVTRTRI